MLHHEHRLRSVPSLCFNVVYGVHDIPLIKIDSPHHKVLTMQGIKRESLAEYSGAHSTQETHLSGRMIRHTNAVSAKMGFLGIDSVISPVHHTLLLFTALKPITYNATTKSSEQ